MKISRLKSRRLAFLYVWLLLGVLLYLGDCLVATFMSNASLALAWFERGIHVGGPCGIVLTLFWFAFPVIRVFYKRVKTRPRE